MEPSGRGSPTQDDGALLLEHVLLITAIAITVVLAAQLLGFSILELFDRAANTARDL
jgi:Flp pilus assembly pilin Flp